MSRYAGFNSVKLTRPLRSAFDLSHRKRLTTRMGRLTPVLITECIPGDTFNGSTEILVRLAPLQSPVYENIVLFVHFFFVPMRLLWSEWEEFITGGRLGVGVDPLVAPIPPYYSIEGVLDNTTAFKKSGLGDYMGVPIFESLAGYVNPAQYADKYVDAAPFLAYQKAWYDYYRDRNFVPDDVFEFPAPSGELSNYNGLSLQVRAYEHDYFTSALPFTQRGEEVLMPLAGQGSVTYLDRTLLTEDDGVTPLPGGGLSAIGLVGGQTGIGSSEAGQVQNIDEVTLDSSSVSINDFRSAYALQVWLERNAVGGSRYNESTLAHFGVKPQDSRLQRAEYLGGGRINVKISEVVSTAFSNDGEAVVPLANLGGYGVTYGNTNKFNYFCPEHGFIIGIASFMNEASYHQGLPKMFRRRSFLDYPWPTFAKLGEQQVDKAELFASAVNLTEDADGQLPLFGYQSRYADWKFIPSTNHGDFHDTLLFWTLTRNFGSSPVLGNLFVLFDEGTQDRIFVVNGEADNFWLYINNQVHVRRALPYFGTPNTLGFS